MKPKKIPVKLIIDIIMLCLMLIEFSAQFTENKIHEIIGIALTTLFFIHNLLNLKWYEILFKGKYNTNRIIILITNILLAISMIITIGSSIPISRTVFTFLGVKGDIGVRRIHTTSAYWSLLIMAIHFGIHVNMIKGKIKNILNKKLIIIFVYIIEIIVVVYGIRTFITADIWHQLTGYYTFGLIKEETIAKDIFNNTIMMLSISFITHNVLKLIRKA